MYISTSILQYPWLHVHIDLYTPVSLATCTYLPLYSSIPDYMYISTSILQYPWLHVHIYLYTPVSLATCTYRPLYSSIPGNMYISTSILQYPWQHVHITCDTDLYHRWPSWHGWMWNTDLYHRWPSSVLDSLPPTSSDFADSYFTEEKCTYCDMGLWLKCQM
jgi:hypothetical protein